MRTCLIWVDPAAGHTWEPEPLPMAGLPSSLIAATGPHGGPMAVAWIREEDIDAVIVLSRPEARSTARYLSTVIAGARPDVRVSVLTPGTGKLASLVVGARALALRTSATETLAALSATAASVTSGIWIRSLARLKSPAPTVGQYLRSIMSRRGHVVTFTPDAVVRDHQWRPPTPAPQGSQLLVASNVDLPQALTETFAGLPVTVIPALEDKKTYGSQAIEFLQNEPLMVRPTPSGAICPVCQDLLFGPHCPYCHVVTRPQGVPA